MSDLSRRTFLRVSTLTLIAAAAPLVTVEQALAAISPATLTRSAFLPYVGKTFRLTGALVSASGVLVEIGDLKPVHAPADERRFSLVFETTSELATGQGTYRVGRVGFGAVDLFLVPVDRGAKHHLYQAVVNRPA
jgi:hypothetical protein